MNKLISANYWFGCDWWLCEVGYLGMHADQLSLACAGIYLWNTSHLRVTDLRMCSGFQHTLHTGTLYEVMKDWAEEGIFKANISLTNVYIETMMMDDNDSSSADLDTSVEEGDGDMSVINMFDDWEGEEINEFMMSAMTAMDPSGGSPEHLSKVWRISVDDAKQTLDVTSQASLHQENPMLSQNYGANDHMMRYKRIKEYFFMDMFFTTSKKGMG